eukprot:5394600-Prymnesium_polylepis.1
MPPWQPRRPSVSRRARCAMEAVSQHRSYSKISRERLGVVRTDFTACQWHPRVSCHAQLSR